MALFREVAEAQKESDRGFQGTTRLMKEQSQESAWRMKVFRGWAHSIS